VRLTFASGDWIGKSKSPAPRRGAALLGIFAVLLQAALVAWHHHPLPLSSRGAPAVLAAVGQEVPGLVDDDCPICFALSHHSAAPVDFAAAPMPGVVPLHAPAIETVWAPAPPYLLFRSRAPPRA
jgi:hypothetical protein